MNNHYQIKILNLKKNNNKKRKNSDGHENYDGKQPYLEKYGKTLMMKNHNNSDINHSRLSKWLLLIVLTTVAWFPMSSIALSCDHVARTQKYAQLLAKIARQLDDTCEKAESFISYIDRFARNLQKNFEQIASHETPTYLKDNLVEDTVKDYFDSPISIVQTSSLNNPDLTRNHPVINYLENLAELSKTKYVTVKLIFDQRFFRMGNIESEDGNNGEKIYSFKVSMWAMFKGCTDSGYCYQDHTKKGFYIKLQTERLRVDVVTVEQTVSAKEYRDIQCRWTGGC